MSNEIWIGTALCRNNRNCDDYMLGPFTSPEQFQKLIKSHIAENDIYKRIYDGYTLDLHRFDGWSNVVTHIQYDENCDESSRLQLSPDPKYPVQKDYSWVALLLPRFAEDGEKVIGVYSSPEAFEADLKNIRKRMYIGYADEFSDGFALETHQLDKPHEDSKPDIRREYNLRGKLTWITLLENGELKPYKQVRKKNGK